MLSLYSLRVANVARDKEWDPDGKIDIAFRATELGGECGELLNVIKKMLREKIGLRGSRATQEDLANECADVLICLDLLCMTAGIDLEHALREKYNSTSAKHGLTVRL